jgi:hypothetical protein
MEVGGAEFDVVEGKGADCGPDEVIEVGGERGEFGLVQEWPSRQGEIWGRVRKCCGA